MGEQTTHSFSRAIAQEVGILPALIFSYLAYKVKKSKNYWMDRYWYYDPLDKIAAKYPYASRSAVAAATKKLEAHKLIVTGKNNRKNYDRTVWYSTTKKSVSGKDDANILFNVDDAKEHGIEAAILLHNQRFWIEKYRKDDPSYTFHPMSPAALAERLPFSLSTIKKTLRALEEEGVIVRRVPATGKTPEYAFASDIRSSTKEHRSTGSEQDATGSEQDGTGSEPIEKGSIQDEKGSKQDNYTYLETIAKPVGNTIEKTPLPATRGVVNFTKDEILVFLNSEDPSSEPSSASGENSSCLGEAVPQWKELSDQNYKHMNSLSEKELETLLRETSGVVRHCLKQMPIEELMALPSDPAPELVLTVVYLHWDCEQQPWPERFIHTLEILKPFVIQMTVDAIRRYRYTDASKIKNTTYGYYAYQLCLDLTGREQQWIEDNEKNLHQKRYEEYSNRWQKEYSILGKDVTRDELSPKAKANLLLRAVQIFNAVGFFYNGDVKNGSLKLFKKDVPIAEKFFTENSGTTVHQIMEVLHQCSIAALEPIVDHDPAFHAKKSTALRFFFKYADQTVAALGISHKFPRISPIDPADS